VSELLPALAGRFGDHADAVRVGDDAVSWEALQRRAHAVGATLTGHRTVVVEALPSLDTIVAVVAALAAGVPVAPIPGDAGPLERQHILRDSGATAILGTPSWDTDGLDVVPLDADGLTPPAAGPLPEPPADAAALIVYTSGTTGPPKGAVLSRRALAADLDGLADAWAWTPEDHLVHGLPLFHVHGLVLGVLGPLRVGSRLTHTGRPTPESYAAAAGSMYFGVPTVWSRVCASPASAQALRTARLLVSGSAPLPVPVFEELTQLSGSSPVERYGMTETLITLSTRADGERRPGWVGVPIEGVETRLVDDDGRSVAPDGVTVGHLQVRGATLFDGYLSGGRGDEAADGWFVTGDSAVVDEGGFHRIVGRTSVDIIKTGGYKVGAGEVEAAILGHPAVIEAAVVGAPDDDLGQRVVAYVVAEGLAPDELDAYLADLLTTHKRPRDIRLIDALPRNAMGKVQKTRLG
jgi:fatty acid CoA ligase FadD36